MKQISYGFWQGMYKIAWPVRFFIELAIVLAIVFLVLFIGRKILKSIGGDIFIKTIFIKVIVFFTTEILYLVGKNKAWAIDSDEKIVEWGRKAVEQPSDIWKVCKKVLKVLFFCLIIFTYFSAIIPDLPISKNINPYYMEHISVVKEFFQNIESNLSDGYESVPPLIIETEKKQEPKKEKVVYISLIEKKNRKILIQKSPKRKSKVICKIDSKQKVVYKNRYKKVGKKYWFKVYVVKKKRTGWIEGSYVKKKQIRKLLKRM